MNRFLLACTIVAVIILTGCADSFDQDVVVKSLQCKEVSGFWWGLWNGMTATLTFIATLFSDKFSVYDACNNGHLYWCGFLLGVGAFTNGTTYANTKTDKE